MEEVHLTNNDPGDPILYSDRTLYEEERAYVEKMLGRPHRKVPAIDLDGQPYTQYHIPVGNVWVGTGR